MKVLVIGGGGFIGKHLTKYLLKNNNLVTIFDNFSNSKKNSITSGTNKVKIIDGDITNFEEVSNAIKDQDVVIHLAAKISVEESVKNPSETFRINVDGTKNVLLACDTNKVKKLIVASSSAVYGEGEPEKKLTENSNINPISPYGESKSIMEQEIKEFISTHDINCIILRFFNIFGVGQSSEYAGVITKFIKKIRDNESLVIFGDGTQTRDFVAIQDVVEAIQNAMLSEKSGIYNIASGKSVTIKELAEFMISLSGKELKIEYSVPREGDIKYSQADISLAKKDLHFVPKFGLNEIKNLL